MVKAFLFDNDGVITAKGTGNEISDRLASNLGVSTEVATELLMLNWAKYTKGKISEDDFWHRIEEKYGQPIDISQRNIWKTWGELKPQEEMIQLVADLKAKNYVVGMLSNVIPNTETLIRENGGYDSFDFTVLSCITGYAKPDSQAYTMALNRMEGIKPHEVVFLDDQERCLVPAEGLGMKTIHVQNAEQAIDKVRQIVGV